MSTRLAVGVGGLVVAWGALRIFAKGERHDGSIRRAYPRGLMKGDKVRSMVKMAQKKQGQRTQGLGAAHFTGAHTPLRTRTMVGAFEWRTTSQN